MYWVSLMCITDVGLNIQFVESQIARGRCIKKRQILAHSAATISGELSLGKMY